MTQSALEIIENGSQFFRLLQTDDNSRYRSWEHCYLAFTKNRDERISSEILDLLCLHLAFYLASWGMYRGSSFLLQKNYRIHTDAVRKLLSSEYRSLWGISCVEYLDIPRNIDKLFDLQRVLKDIYTPIRISAYESINRPKPTQDISDVLITKILLGTLGCTPAYDRFFIKGLRDSGTLSSMFNRKGITNLSRYYVENNDLFEKWREEVSSHGLEYPQMKVLDMCFW